MKYYHGTTYSNLPEILEKGLSSKEAQFGRKWICFTDDPVDALQFGPVVLEVDVPAGYIYLDKDMELVSRKRIPPEFISVYAKVPESSHIDWAFDGQEDWERGRGLLEEGRYLP